MARKKKQGFVKRQFEFSPTDLEKLDFLVKKHGFASGAEGVRLGIRLLYWISNMQDQGQEVGYFDHQKGRFEGLKIVQLM